MKNTREMRMIDCEIFQIGCRRSQIISKIQRRLHPHKFLKTQIRNVYESGRKVEEVWYFHSLSKMPRLRRLLETKITRHPCRRRTGEASTPRAEKFGDLIMADHNVLNEEGESRNNHRCAVVVQTFGNSMDSVLSV